MPIIRSFGEPPSADSAARLDGGAAWRVPEETPVAFVYSGRNYAVMLATPLDLADFAVGFSLTERVVDAPDDIATIDIHASERGVEFRIGIAAARLERFFKKRIRSGLDRIHSHRNVTMCRNQNQRRRRSLCHFGKKLKTRHARHPDIRKNDIRRRSVQP